MKKKQSTQAVNFTTSKLREPPLIIPPWHDFYGQLELTYLSFVFYKNYSTEMLLFSSSYSSSPSSSSSGRPLSQPVPMMKCKCLPSVRWITFWLCAGKCCYVLTKSVICWGFFITICLFALKGICQLLLLKPQGGWQEGGGGTFLPSPPADAPRVAWQGWRIAALPSLFTQLPAPVIKLDHRHCALVKDKDQIKGESIARSSAMPALLRLLIYWLLRWYF